MNALVALEAVETVGSLDEAIARAQSAAVSLGMDESWLEDFRRDALTGAKAAAAPGRGGFPRVLLGRLGLLVVLASGKVRLVVDDYTRLRRWANSGFLPHEGEAIEAFGCLVRVRW